MIVVRLLCLALLFTPSVVKNYAGGQTTALESVQGVLKQTVQPSILTDFQLQQYLLARKPPLPKPTSAVAWSAQEKQLRDHVLNDIAWHGWPRAWIDAAPKFEQVGVIETGDGYRIRKFRYEIVPGLTSTALLYEPEHMTGRMPAILNLIGHEPEGISVEYEQKRCINFAKRGIIALDMGWMGFGDLSQPDNAHDFAADLNLVGSNAFGLFYLAMRRGLDYLAASPNVDPSRIGATGLSGGGWQTTVLGALDTRVAVSVEVAGIGSWESNLAHPLDTDEIEEDAPDIAQNETYAEFVAMRAPKPTMLIHNAVDSCCFRAPLVKRGIYNDIKPFFQLYGEPQNLGWYESFNPGVHNYQLANREQAYRFFTEHFHMPIAEKEIFSDYDVRSARQLAIGAPADNLTILGLAKQFAGQIRREPIPAAGAARDAWATAQRKTLESVIRYSPLTLVRAFRLNNSHEYNFSTLSYRFDLSNGLSATGVWFKEDAAPPNAPVTIVLNDDGHEAAAQAVYERLARGEQVLALDLLFIGKSAPGPDPAGWALLVDSTGERSLGMEVEQLVTVANWLRSQSGRTVSVDTDGIRSQMIALVAAAIDPTAFSAVVSQRAMKSMAHLLDAPVPFRSAPELFCLDLYKDFDIDSLTALASPAKINQSNEVGK